MIVHLVRHGQTASNRDGLGQGRADHPLTGLGVQQADAIAKRLSREPVTKVITSPLQRARTLAEAIAGASRCEVEVRDELIEMDVGETDGVPAHELRERFPEFMARWAEEDCTDVRMPGGETLREVRDRVVPLFSELESDRSANVAVVSHNFVLKVVLAHLLQLEVPAFRRFTVDLASVSTLSLGAPRTSVVRLNDTCHLYGLNL